MSKDTRLWQPTSALLSFQGELNVVELLDVTFERLMAARRGAASASPEFGVAEAEANALLGGALALGATITQGGGRAAPAKTSPNPAQAEANALLGGALALATTMAQSAGGARLLVDQGILTRLLALGRWLLGANGGGAPILIVPSAIFGKLHHKWDSTSLTCLWQHG